MIKKILLAALPVLFVVACKKNCPECDTCPKPDCVPNLDSGLIVYLPFNGNFNDASGNGNNATAMNGAFLTKDLFGRANKSAGFDGVNDYLIIPGSNKLNTEEITVSMRVMVNTIGRRQALLNRVNFDDVTGVDYGIGEALASDEKFSFGVPSNTEDCSKVHAYDNSIAVIGGDPVQAGRWYTLISTFGADGQKMYIDGQLVASTNRPFNTLKQCSESDIVIGGWWKNDIISIDGKIDEVRIYNRVVSSCEISELGKLDFSNGAGDD